MKKKIFLLLILLLLTGCSKNKNQLVMVTEAGFAPYEYYENGEIVGVDVDIAKEIAKYLNKELVVKDVSFDSIINEVKSGKADFGAAGISYTEERSQEVDFTIDYSISKQVIIVKNNVNKVDDLNNKKISVQLGSVADSYITKNYKNAVIVRQKKYLAAIEDLKNDKVYNFDAKNKPFTYTNKYKDGLIMADDFKEFLYYTQNNNGPKLLSFEGSYLLTNDRTEKFIANHFSETVAVHDYQNIFNINYYLNIFDPDIVLFEMADYTFQEYYFSQYYMETIELQPLLNLEITDIFNQEGRLQYIKEINGEYVNYIIKKPVDCFDYKYLLVGDKIYDLYTYDNENIALTILLKNDININSARVITKKANANFGLAYSLFQ